MQQRVILILVAIVFLSACTYRQSSPITNCIGDGIVQVSFETPHPYPEGQEGSTLVWKETLQHKGVQRIKTKVKHVKFNTYTWAHVGVLDSVTGESREYLEPTSLVSYIDFPIHTPITDESIKYKWVGDYVIVRDNNHDIIAVFGGDCGNFTLVPDLCEKGYDVYAKGDTLTFELYSDEKDTSYGFSIDQYTYCEKVLPYDPYILR